MLTKITFKLFPYHPVDTTQTYEELPDCEGKGLEAVLNNG